jgi:phage gp29-like protein
MTAPEIDDGTPAPPRPMMKEIAGPTLGGVRSPLGSYPASVITPQRLAAILRGADVGDNRLFLELAEQMEETDPHYAAVLGTRKREGALQPIQVIPASDSPTHHRHAALVRRWADRGQLKRDLFHLLDAIGKGMSVLEVIWGEEPDGVILPQRLVWRDPRWFRLDLVDLTTPLLWVDGGPPLPLAPRKFIVHQHQAKSGLPMRSGIARIAAWAWMFKTFTSRDWQIFVAVYGQPLRLGKYGTGASEADKDVLWRAVSNLAADCAAIIPESMMIEFAGVHQGSRDGELYMARADWLDRQVSKLVLGQTSTTEGQQGSHAIGKTHRKVQEAIAEHDALMVAGTLDETIVRWIVEIRFGPQPVYPRLHFGRDEPPDLALMGQCLAQLVPLGLKVDMAEVRDRMGFSEPDADAELLKAPAAAPPDDPQPPTISPAGAAQLAALAAQPGALPPDAPPPVCQQLGERLAREALPLERGWLETAKALLDGCDTLEAFGDRLPEMMDSLGAARLATLCGDALTVAHAAGIADVQQDCAREAAADAADDGGNRAARRRMAAVARRRPGRQP